MPLEEFFKQFKLSNSKSKQIKDSLVLAFHALKHNNLIYSYFILGTESDGLTQEIQVDKLTTNLLSRSKYIKCLEKTN